MQILKFLGALLLSLILIIVLGLGYLGFIPGLSKIFGSDKPRDLGVAYTESDYQAMSGKVGLEIKELPASTPLEKSIIEEGSHEVSETFSPAEMTAAINKNTWRYFPFVNVQIRVNADNSIEASGLVVVDRLLKYAQALGATAEEVQMGIDAAKLPNTTFPFYVKGKGEVVDNQVSGNFLSAEVGRLPVPAGILSDIQGRIVGAVEAKLVNNPSISIKEARLENGSAKFVGTLPNVEYVVK